MYKDEYKKTYKTIPFAIHKTYNDHRGGGVIAHQHREVELIALTEGRVNFYIEAQCYSMQCGDVLVIPPYAIHRAEIPADTLTAYNCICFDVDLLWDKELCTGLLEHTLSSVNPLISHGTPYAKRLQDYVKSGCDAYEGQKSGWEMEAIGSMHLFFGVLKQYDYFRSNTAPHSANSFAQKAIDYIAKHYATPITSTTTAVALYMNNSYFCRLFKKVFGCCFSDYVLAYRLEKAKTMLDHTQLSITEIAFQCGFNGCSYFGKSFRRRFGRSPLAYRKSTLVG